MGNGHGHGQQSYSDSFESESPVQSDKTGGKGILRNGWPTSNSRNKRKSREHNTHASSFPLTNKLSNKRSVARRRFLEGIQVKLTVWRENKLTDVDEMASEKSLRYRVAKFRAAANVTLPKIPAHETWQVGWVQACFFIKFVNQYGALGYTSWEFPQLTRGQLCVNDSDGNLFPWYSFRKGMREIQGPTKTETTFEVVMNDSPSSQLSLSVPSHHYHARKCLSSVNRTQEFKVWLVVRNVDTDDVYPIRCISWELSAVIGVNTNKEQGERSTVLDDPQKPPIIHKTAHPVPLQALLSPECNKAQVLIWRPTDPRRKVSVIVPPAWSGAPPLTTKDLENPFLVEEERMRKQMAQRLQDIPAY